MPHRFSKINEVMARIQRAKSAATAFRLAGHAAGTDIYYPDLIHVLEGLLPDQDEIGEALADISRCPPGCVYCTSKEA